MRNLTSAFPARIGHTAAPAVAQLRNHKHAGEPDGGHGCMLCTLRRQLRRLGCTHSLSRFRPGCIRRVLKFRNYRPQDESLRAHVVERPPPPSVAVTEAVEEEQRSLVAKAIDKERPLNLAPKKANWDLKRDVERKLARLERQTQRAIADILRARVKRGGGDEGSGSAGGAAGSDASGAAATVSAGSEGASGGADLARAVGQMEVSGTADDDDSDDGGIRGVD